MAFTRISPKGKTEVEPHPEFLVALTRNIKSQEVVKLNNLNRIIIIVELYEVQTGLKQCYS
jgi:hypothetical protein